MKYRCAVVGAHFATIVEGRRERMKISIIGSGWVGMAVGGGLSELGNEVIFHDIIDKALPHFTEGVWIMELGFQVFKEMVK